MRKLSLSLAVFRQLAASFLVQVRHLEGASEVLTATAHRLRVGGNHADNAHVVQHRFGRDRLRAHPALGEGDIFRHLRIEVMADHHHIQQLGDRVDGIGQGRIGRRGKCPRLAGDLDDVRRVSAAGAFGVIRVDGAAVDGADRVFDEAGLIQRVGVDADLHIVLIGHVQRAVDDSRRGAVVLMVLETAGTRFDLLDRGFG